MMNKMMSSNSSAAFKIDRGERKMLIYLVDDEFILIKTLEGFLKDLGHELRSFDSVSSMIDDGCDSPDLILIDLEMPRKNALNAVHEVHRRYPGSDIVAMNAVLPFKDAVSCGVYSYLNKPIRLGELELLLARVSERKKNRGD